MLQLSGRSFVRTVCAAVSRQINELSERLTADVTAVRSLICVYTAVSRQTTEVGERLTADVTAARSLICMYSTGCFIKMSTFHLRVVVQTSEESRDFFF